MASSVAPSLAQWALAEVKQVLGPGVFGSNQPANVNALAVNSGPLIPGAHGGDVVITPTYDKVNFPSTGTPVMQTPHLVPNSYLAGTFYYRGMWAPNTAEIHFSKIDSERNYDYVWIGRSDRSVYGTKVSGLYQDYWMGTNWGLNEPVYEWIQTDSSVQSWGYSADQFSGIWSNPNFNSAVPIKLSTIYGGGNYANSEDVRWSISVRGAAALQIHFKTIDTESYYDYIYLTDGTGYTAPGISGHYTTGYTTPFMQGSSIQLRLTSDGSVTYTGFEVDQVNIQWQYGAFFAGYGPRANTVIYGQSKTFGRGVFLTSGSPRDVNDVYTFNEFDRTDSAGKRIKQVAYAPELPGDYTECDPYYPQAGECRIHHFEPAAFEFKIRISDGSGPITIEDVYRDDTNPLPSGTNLNWQAQFGCGPSIGIAMPPLTFSCGVNFQPTANGWSSSVQVTYDAGRYEGRVLIPVANGAGTSVSKAVGVIWRLKANTGTETFYSFYTMTHVIIVDEIQGYSGSGTYWWNEYHNADGIFASDVVIPYTPTGGANHGWVQGMLDFGNSASHFSKDIRLGDFTMSGWRDQYTSTNGWREMDNRHTYFLNNEAGSDAVAWARVRGPLSVAHTVTFTYYQYRADPNGNLGTWYQLGSGNGVYDPSWPIPLHPSGSYFMPSATWIWTNYNPVGVSRYGSYQVEIRVDGGLAALLSFYLAAS